MKTIRGPFSSRRKPGTRERKALFLIDGVSKRKAVRYSRDSKTLSSTAEVGGTAGGKSGEKERERKKDHR